MSLEPGSRILQDNYQITQRFKPLVFKSYLLPITSHLTPFLKIWLKSQITTANNSKQPNNTNKNIEENNKKHYVSPKGQKIIRIKRGWARKEIIQKENIISTTLTHSFQKISWGDIFTPKISEIFLSIFHGFFLLTINPFIPIFFFTIYFSEWKSFMVMLLCVGGYKIWLSQLNIFHFIFIFPLKENNILERKLLFFWLRSQFLFYSSLFVKTWETNRIRWFPLCTKTLWLCNILLNLALIE